MYKFVLFAIAFVSPSFAVRETSFEKQIDELYKDISGYGISQEEANDINNKGGASTYGEATYGTFARIIKEVEKELKKGKVLDFGCGVGKGVMQFYLTSDCPECIGIELSPTRLEGALKAKKKLTEKGLLKKGKKLEFIKQNILDADINNAAVVFMCSTCFPAKLMKQLTNKLAKLKKNAVVITLKQLEPDKAFQLEKTLNLPMSWSKESPVYFYRRV